MSAGDGDGSMVALHNLGSEPQRVRLELAGCDGSHRLVDLLAAGSVPVGTGGQADVELDGYGYRWLHIEGSASKRTGNLNTGHDSGRRDSTA